MSSKLVIESLAVTEDKIPRRRLVQERGELAFIEDGGEFGHLTFFTIKAGKGLYRGNHAHERKVEHFYLARGEALLEWVDLDTGGTGRARLGTGDMVTIHPRLAHRLSCPHGECFVVEYFKGRHEADDDIPFLAFAE